MAYVIAWALYLLMAGLLQAGHERYLSPSLPAGRWRTGLRALLAVVLFTPGVVASEAGLSVVPACIGVLFNVLAHSGLGLAKALLPLLLSTSVVFGVLWLRAARAGRAPAAA